MVRTQVPKKENLFFTHFEYMWAWIQGVCAVYALYMREGKQTNKPTNQPKTNQPRNLPNTIIRLVCKKQWAVGSWKDLSSWLTGESIYQDKLNLVSLTFCCSSTWLSSSWPLLMWVAVPKWKVTLCACARRLLYKAQVLPVPLPIFYLVHF